MGPILRERPEVCIVKPTRFHGPNVVSCEIVSDAQRNPLIGAYLPLSTIDCLEYLEEALNRFPGWDPIVMGDLNADIDHLQNPQSQQVAGFLASFGLVDLLRHFRQQMRFRHMKTWWKARQGKLLHSIYNYILGLDRQLFETVGIRDLSNFAFDRFALCARLLRKLILCHGGYLRGRRAFPLTLTPMVPLNFVETKFQYLKALETPPSPCACAPIIQWMSEESLRMIYTCAALRCQPDHNRNVARTMIRTVRWYLTADSLRRAEVAAEYIVVSLGTPQWFVPRYPGGLNHPEEVVPPRIGKTTQPFTGGSVEVLWVLCFTLSVVVPVPSGATSPRPHLPIPNQ